MLGLRLDSAPIARCLVLAAALLVFSHAWSQDEQPRGYSVNPGDRLAISVWGEEELTAEVLVGPDGQCSFPLAGIIHAEGRTVAEIRDDVAQKLSRFIPDPVVTVSLVDIAGNKIYVIGQVNNPGEYVMNPSLDVMQALSVAGGTTAFADLRGITILRRRGDSQVAMGFRYDEVARGRNLRENIQLESGDVVVVP